MPIALQTLHRISKGYGTLNLHIKAEEMYFKKNYKLLQHKYSCKEKQRFN